MKPEFALTLSFDGIGLLHRSEGAWLSLGDVPLNDPDLAEALKALLDQARTLEDGAITTKLVIPNQQIRYLKFESESRDIDILEAQVRSTLNGATPYHVSELAYDWSMTGGEVCVAAVAIETLTEAESFAVDHGFSPLCFVAVPDDGAFQGEPFFGETVHAGDVLEPGDSVERDEEALFVTGKVELPEPAPKSEALPEPEPEPEAAPVSENEPTPDPGPAPGFQSARSTSPAPKPPIPKAPPPEAPNPIVLGDPVVEPPLAASSETANPDKQSNDSPAMSFASARKALATDAPELPQARFQPASDSPADMQPDSAVPPAGALDTPEPIDATTNKPVPTQEELADVAQARSDTLKPASAELTEAPPDKADNLVRPKAKPSAPASNHPGRLAFLSQRKSSAGSSGATAAQRAQAAAKNSGAAISAGIKSKLGADGMGSGLTSALKTGLKTGLKSGVTKSRGVAARMAEAATSLRPKSAGPTATQQATVQEYERAVEDERQRMTVFGARNPDNASTETNPRFVALALTAGLLFLLVGIAAWAAIFLDGGLSSLFRSSEDVQFADDPAAIEAPEAVAPVAEPEIAVLPQDPDLNTEELADESIDALRPNDPISEELSPDEARARYAATGIWQMSPTATRAPLTGQFEDVYQTSLDPDVRFSDAVALPQVTALLPSPQPAIPGNPLAPGTDNVARDARGFVLATPEGTVTPDRLVTVFTGPPPLVPPATPQRAEPDLVEVALAPEPETRTTEDAGLRPRTRPSDLSDDFERAVNGDRTLEELQTIRPRLRPQSAQEQALAEAGISPEIAQNQDNLFDDATKEAVTASLKPRTRPANFAALVEQSRETAAADPVSVEQRVSVDIPTTTSVARAATESSRISLRSVNLIGVYGSENNRRALVRLPNGRYRKVEVGDRLDGGQVAAIGDGELRYVKRGQFVVLKLPSS